MFSVFHKIIRVILIIIPIIVLGWLISKELVPTGKAESVYDMRRETPFISKLYPKDRVSEAMRDANGDYYRILQDEPVYFDLKPNTQFERVSVSVTYRFSRKQTLKFGGLTNKKDWLFDFREIGTEFPEDSPLVFRGLSSGKRWRTQTEIFDFSKLVLEGERYRFGFFAPEMRPGEIEISEIKVVFEKKPMGRDEIIDKILQAVAWRVGKLIKMF